MTLFVVTAVRELIIVIDSVECEEPPTLLATVTKDNCRSSCVALFLKAAPVDDCSRTPW